MKPGYTIRDRGLTNFTRIFVFNWPAANLIDHVKWNDTPHFDAESIGKNPFLVAVFKIKPKP